MPPGLLLRRKFTLTSPAFDSEWPGDQGGDGVVDVGAVVEYGVDGGQIGISTRSRRAISATAAAVKTPRRPSALASVGQPLAWPSAARGRCCGIAGAAGERQIAEAGQAHQRLRPGAHRRRQPDISARPRVIRAARALSPRPRPATMPQAMASTFLTAPPSSAPMTSSESSAEDRWCRGPATGRRGSFVGAGERHRGGQTRARPRPRRSGRRARRWGLRQRRCRRFAHQAARPVLDPLGADHGRHPGRQTGTVRRGRCARVAPAPPPAPRRRWPPRTDRRWPGWPDRARHRAETADWRGRG